VDLNPKLIETKTNQIFSDYIGQVKQFISNYDFQKVLYGLGELIDSNQKQFAKTKMKAQIL